MSVFRTKGRSVFALIMLGVLLVAGGVPAQAGDEEFGAEAKAFVEDMAVKAIAELTVSDLDKDKRRRRFREMMHEYFAFKGIAKWVLGRYWRRATEVERKEYLELFEQLMVAVYTERFERYSGETLSVERAEVRGGKDVLVHSRLLRPNGLKPIKVAWRVRADGHVYRVVDIMVEGLSMGLTQREEFASFIRQNNGRVQSLIIELRKRIEAAT